MNRGKLSDDQVADYILEWRDAERTAQDLIDLIPKCVDCPAYTLAIGPEVYLSPNDQTADPTTVTIRKLSNGNVNTLYSRARRRRSPKRPSVARDRCSRK
jgi:hypothetical protein